MLADQDQEKQPDWRTPAGKCQDLRLLRPKGDVQHQLWADCCGTTGVETVQKLCNSFWDMGRGIIPFQVKGNVK